MIMAVFKGKLRFGDVSLIIENETQWKELLKNYGNLTVDETLEAIHNSLEEVECVVWVISWLI